MTVPAVDLVIGGVGIGPEVVCFYILVAAEADIRFCALGQDLVPAVYAVAGSTAQVVGFVGAALPVNSLSALVAVEADCVFLSCGSLCAGFEADERFKSLSLGVEVFAGVPMAALALVGGIGCTSIVLVTVPCQFDALELFGMAGYTILWSDCGIWCVIWIRSKCGPEGKKKA